MPVEYIRQVNTQHMPMVVTNVISTPRSNYECLLQQSAENHSNGYFYTDAFKKRANSDCSNMFNHMTTLKGINMTGFDFTNTKNMEYMFYDCNNLETVTDINTWDVSNVSNFHAMFGHCRNLSYDLSNWNVSNAKDMTYMFQHAKLPSGIFEMNVSGCNLSWMFNYANAESASFSDWNINRCNGFDIFGDIDSLTLQNWNIISSNFYGFIGGGVNQVFIEGFNIVNSNVALYNKLKSADIRYIDFNNSTPFSFNNQFNLISANLYNWNIANFNSFNDMFFNCSNLTQLDLSSWNVVSEGVSFADMFLKCHNLTSINMFNCLNMNNITNCYRMFGSCRNLSSIELEFPYLFDPSIKELSKMFENCYSLTDITLTNFSLNNGYMQYMFFNCTNLRNLNMPGFILDSTPEYNGSMGSFDLDIFYNCTNLYDLNINDWCIANSNDINISRTINHSLNCVNAQNWTVSNINRITFGIYNNSINFLNVSNWDIANTNQTVGMFEYVKSFNISDWIIANTNVCGMFINCEAQFIDMSSWNATGLYNFEAMFQNCTNVTSIRFPSNLDVNSDSLERMFYNCTSLSSIDMSSWNTNNISTAYRMFGRCSSLSSVTGLSKLNIAGRADGMFAGCTSLSSINVLELDTTNITDMAGMFTDCSSLPNIHLSTVGLAIDTYNVTNMSWMFSGCSSATNIQVSRISTASLLNMSHMFSDCSNVELLDFIGWNTTKVKTFNRAFEGCSNLRKMYLPLAFRATGVNKPFFYGADRLCEVYVEGNRTWHNFGSVAANWNIHYNASYQDFLGA